MDLTIYSRGRPAGTLTRRQEGLYTLFEARLPPAEGLSRLYLFDAAGHRLCLGVMEPRPGGRVLRRKLSRAALSPLTAPLSHAATEPGTLALSPASSAPIPEERTGCAPGDGPLLLELEGRRCLALPCAPGLASRAGLRLHRIAGRDYLLFRY